MANGPIIPGEDDSLFQEPILNGEDPMMAADPEMGPMDDEEFEALMGAAVGAAESYVDDNLSPSRELAAQYYSGAKFGNEVEGRSQAVSTDVRDKILATMPGLIRLLASSASPVTFEANPGTPQEQAELQTNYVHHVLYRDNAGFESMHDALKDALQKKTGVFTWWWEEKEEVTATRFTGLGEQAFALLQLEATDRSDADRMLKYEIEVENEEPDETQSGGTMVPDILSSTQPGDADLTGQAPQMVRDGIVRKRLLRRRVRWEAVPPEEFIVTPSAQRDLDRFALVGRRQEKTIGELVALGHNEEEIRALVGSGGSEGSTLSNNVEAMQRNEGASLDKLFDPGFQKSDPSSEYVKYIVVYVLVDYDGDGIPERRKVVMVGNANRVIYNEMHDDDMVPFGTICPDPEQHSPFGDSMADWLMDVQEIKSELVRGLLDSLADSISTQRALNKNNVNMDDALNPATGAVIRVNGAPAENIMDLSRPFAGQNIVPVIQYMDDVATRRSGSNPASPAGIKPEALQSTDSDVANAQIDAAQERTELIARIFAETGISRLYRGVRNLILRNQDFRRVLRLQGRDTIVDPRSWNSDLDCVAGIGTGKATGNKRLMGLAQIMAKQEIAIEKYGPNNPMVGMREYCSAIADYIHELGFNDSSRYAKPFTDETQRQADEQAAQIAAQPTPQQLLAEAQNKKTEADFNAKMAGLMAKRDADIRADGTKRFALELKFATDAAKLMGQFGDASEREAVTLRQEHTEAAHRLADDMRADAEPAPEPKAGNTGGTDDGNNA